MRRRRRDIQLALPGVVVIKEADMGLWEFQGAGKCLYLVVFFETAVTGGRRLVSCGIFFFFLLGLFPAVLIWVLLVRGTLSVLIHSAADVAC